MIYELDPILEQNALIAELHLEDMVQLETRLSAEARMDDIDLRGEDE